MIHKGYESDTMHLVINIDPRTKEQIERLLSTDKSYKSIDEFVARSITNQLALEGIIGAGLVEPAKESKGQRRPRAPKSAANSMGSEAALHSRTAGEVMRIPGPSVLQIDNSLLVAPLSAVSTVPCPKLSNEHADRPLWGQINRFAPAKMSLRVLANLLASRKTEWIDLKLASARICEQAPLVKTILQERDRIAGKKRGEGLSTAFPKDERLSLQRFASQYLGYLAKKSGVPQGLLADLSFVNIQEADDGTIQIGITKAGLQFATLESPMIDATIVGGGQSGAPLSKEEVRFLLNHMRDFRPGELAFLKHVTQLVRNGARNPTTLLNSVDEYFRADSRGMPTITEAVVGTMRAGAVSKLVEMGVLRIEKDGTRSTYSLTEDADLILEGSG